MGIFSLLGSVATALFGGGSSRSNQEIVSKALDKILPETDKEKEAAALAEDAEINKDADSARAYDPKDMPMVVYQPGMGLIPWFLTWTLDLLGRFVDLINHIIRPGYFIYLTLGGMGLAKLPSEDSMGVKMWTIYVIVVTFFFGGRALVKDILPGIKDIIASWKK